MEERELQIIQDRIGYRFKNVDLLQQAFIRRSYSKENGGEDNEILEFIGDKALDIVIVQILTEMYGFYCSECGDFDSENDFDEFCCERSEGQLTAIKSKLVEKKTLAEVISVLKLNRFLIMGEGDKKNKVDNEEAVKEDLFEAIIGAVTLDCDWNLKEIRSTVEYMLEPKERLNKNNDENYVELIQEWSLRRFKELPDIFTGNSSYDDENMCLRIVNEIRSIPKRDSNISLINSEEYFKTLFFSKLRLQGIDKVFVGYGRSKNESRRDVCKLAYNYLKKNNMLFSVRNEIENPNVSEAINQLETLARRGYFSIPTYDFNVEYDKDGNQVWECDCHIKEYKEHYTHKSSKKREAKKLAAFKMLQFIITS